jgi:hypothetical protein
MFFAISCVFSNEMIVAQAYQNKVRLVKNAQMQGARNQEE